MSNICDDLRAAILQAAMQGKLTKQLPEDGNAQDLLTYRRDDYDKKHKSTAISENEKPFSIPSTWQWIRIGDFFETITGGTPSKTHIEYYGGDYAFFKPSDLDAGKYITNASGYLTEAGRIASRQLPVNTILVCCIGSIGKVAIMGVEGTTNQQINAILPNGNVDIEYLYYAIKSPVFFEKIWSLASSTTISIVNKSKMDSIIIPLPPLAEQKRIVEKVDELMARVADLEQSTDALASLKKAFPDDIKASLLQYAMQGKLTKQLPEDGNAEDLLEKIKAEKEKLIAEGKIKKQKPLAPITDDEITFSIPENWKWVRLRDICTKIADGDHNPPKGLSRESEYLMLSSQNINNDALVNMSKVRYLDKSTFEKVNERTNLQKDDILFTSVGSLGRSCIFREDINACFQRSVSVLTTLICNEYLKLFLDSPFIQNKVYKEATGTAQKGFYLNQLEKCPIAIPPLAEQKRIVERLKNTMQNINAVGELIASE